ncbi:Arm DNA-binding domain-containing protein [Hahella ganghwensis]|uniref:Arm DNA-binding domain-containing protein n=1 Tax=Hahella ganghwensis TaxID=286420 RepID=UPI00037392A1|nr:DUF3596 domain-containing protein [Hahella ganghwensis]
MSGLPKGVTKLPPGVRLHYGKLQIRFTLQGRRCAEVITDVVSKSNVRYCENKLRQIKNEIQEGRFDYAAHFPDSPLVSVFSGGSLKDANRSVAQGIDSWLKVCEAKKAPSTYRNYVHKANHVREHWGSALIRKIPKSDIELFQAKLLKSGLSVKTVNDIFTVVRAVWGDAFSDGVITSNPLDLIKNVEKDGDPEPDPFTKSELGLISQVKTKRVQDKNMFLFDCWAGLSISELIALAWEDIDRSGNYWKAKVSRARVESIYKVPKEKGRVREIEFIGPAMDWIKSQYEHTFMREPVKIDVIQRDNITRKTEHVRFVFLNSVSDSPWHNSSVGRWFTHLLKKAKVRHRGPNQCRHTYASQLLSHYVPMEWIAKSMGHADTTMIKKHYARWIPSDSPSMAGLITSMVNGETPSETGQSLPGIIHQFPRTK